MKMKTSATEQHDDHIWLTVRGEGWAVHRIENETTFILWRGYAPDLEYEWVVWPKWWWKRYVKAAVRMLAIAGEAGRGERLP